MEDARVLEMADATDLTDDLPDPAASATGRPAVSCAPAVELVPMPRADAERIARALKAVAEPTRLQLLSMIQASADGEACVCDLTAPLGLTQPTVSHHLKTLVDAGLITREKRGIWAWYAIVPDRLDAIRGLLH